MNEDVFVIKYWKLFIILALGIMAIFWIIIDSQKMGEKRGRCEIMCEEDIQSGKYPFYEEYLNMSPEEEYYRNLEKCINSCISYTK